MGKIILLHVLLLSSTLSYSQSQQGNSTKLLGGLTNEDFFTKSDLVIDGIFINIGMYETKIDGVTDTNVIFSYRIRKVYKGDPSLKWRTVDVICKKSMIPDIDLHFQINEFESPFKAPDVLKRNGINSHFDYSMFSIYFLAKSDISEDDLPEECAGGQKYSFMHDDMSRLYLFDDKIIGLNDLIFQNKEEMHDYMRQFEGYTIPQYYTPSRKQQPEKSENHNPPVIEADSATQKIIEERWGDSKKKALTNPTKSDENTLTLQIANQEPSYDAVTDKYYVNFDVLASSNNPNIYFDGVDLRIGYNSALFGSNIIANGKLTVSVGSYFDIVDGYAFFVMRDLYSNGVRVIYSADLGYPNRVPLDSAPRPLLHFKIEVLPNSTSNQSSIIFLDTASTAANSSYTLSSSADFFDYIAYDQVFFIHSDTIPVIVDGSPVITTDLSAISMIAGLGDTLAIRGYHFGEEEGNVYFTAADRGGIVPNTTETDFLKGLDVQYYGPWSDTLIKVIVPSRVYRGYENDNPSSSGGAGTGPVKIRTANGDSCISATSLHIPYSVINVRTGNVISRVHLARENCDYDFQFTLHEHYNNPIHANKIAVMDSALRYWSTLTGLTLVLERDISGNLVFETGQNH